jgi:mRNA turnover protein 4
MPKSKRSRAFHMSQVGKKSGREQRDKLFENVRECVPQYQHCLAFSVDNMRNNHLKEVRRELTDSRLFFGKTKLMSKALGQTPEEAQAPSLDRLSAHLSGNVGLLFTNRDPVVMLEYLDSFTPVDFARAGSVSKRDFVVPPGIVYSTGGEVDPSNDVPMGHTVEPELRRLGMPTSMVRGKVFLGSGNGSMEVESEEGYVVCREGDVLDSRQTRLLKLFGVCLAQFQVKVLA